MPEWMHNRAEHILAKNPSMPKSEAFAIATQQMHAGGHGPKGYGTTEGRRTAKAKFNTPKDDQQRSNPGGLESPKMKHASVGRALVLLMNKIGFAQGFQNSAFAGQPAQNGPGMKAQSQQPPFVAPPLAVKAAGVGVGSGMTASQYSGPLSFGPFKQTSGIPPFQRPPLTAPAEEKTAEQRCPHGHVISKTAGCRTCGYAKTAAPMASATGAMGPKASLTATQRMGQPKTTGFAGPSISDVSKPKGFGKPLSGALKNQL
jgi:hypothetical protein